MWITDKSDNLLERVSTSFEIAYMSLCGFDIDTNTLRELFNSQNPGWVKFFPDLNDYAVDDTSLVYLALLDKGAIDERHIYAFTQDALINLRGSCGLLKKSLAGETDPVANFHFLALLHHMHIRDERIESALELWLDAGMSTTPYYHNRIFILYTLRHFMKYLMDCRFKTKLATELERYHAPKLSQLQCRNGILHKSEVYFHLFEPLA